LLFYHVKLHCYVVVELKAVKFKPEYKGKMEFYLTALNEQYKEDDENDAIGIIVCKSKELTAPRLICRKNTANICLRRK